MPQPRAEWGLTAGQAGLLTLSVQLGFAAGAVGSPVLAVGDVVAPRRLMLLGPVGAALANAGLVLADGPQPTRRTSTPVRTARSRDVT